MKKEVKIAIVAIVGIMLLFFGMTFLKGLDLFSSNKLYKIRFSDISGLSTSTPIYADGYKVGVIKDIHYDFSKQGEILADVGINEAMPIPQGTRAEIASDLLGNVQVKLIRPALSAATLAEGGIIDGTISDNALGSVKSMVPDIQKMLPKLDSILYNVNRLLQDPALAAAQREYNHFRTDHIYAPAQRAAGTAQRRDACAHAEGQHRSRQHKRHYGVGKRCRGQCRQDACQSEQPGRKDRHCSHDAEARQDDGQPSDPHRQAQQPRRFAGTADERPRSV